MFNTSSFMDLKLSFNRKDDGTYVFENPNDPRLHNALGRYYAKVGDIKNSIKYHESAISLYPLTKDAWGGLYYYITYAQSMGIIGNSDKTIQLLSEIFKRPGYLHWWDLEFHPFFYFQAFLHLVIN